MLWKILILVLAVVLFGAVALDIVVIALRWLVTAFEWLAGILRIIGIQGILGVG